jgi:uncharacterized membrane protein YfcA
LDTFLPVHQNILQILLEFAPGLLGSTLSGLFGMGGSVVILSMLRLLAVTFGNLTFDAVTKNERW